MFLQVRKKRGKNLNSLGQRLKTMVMVDWHPPNCRFEQKKKNLWRHVSGNSCKCNRPFNSQKFIQCTYKLYLLFYWIWLYFFLCTVSYSQIRCIALRVCKLRIIWVGVELMQITMQCTRPAWPAKTKLRMTINCSRIVKEIVMMSGIFVEGRRQTLLYSCKR